MGEELKILAYGLSSTGKELNLDNMYVNGRYVNVGSDSKSVINKVSHADFQIYGVCDSEVGVEKDRELGTHSSNVVMQMMQRLQTTAEGLVIITSGEKDMLYGRKGEEMKRMKPIPVEVRSTLGAGDTFKAGCLYALLRGMSDAEIVRFASACSAIAISRFPLPLNPPTMEEVKALIG